MTQIYTRRYCKTGCLSVQRNCCCFSRDNIVFICVWGCKARKQTKDQNNSMTLIFTGGKVLTSDPFNSCFCGNYCCAFCVKHVFVLLEYINWRSNIPATNTSPALFLNVSITSHSLLDLPYKTVQLQILNSIMTLKQQCLK